MSIRNIVQGTLPTYLRQLKCLCFSALTLFENYIFVRTDCAQVRSIDIRGRSARCRSVWRARSWHW